MSRFFFILLLFIFFYSSFTFSTNAKSNGGCLQKGQKYGNTICISVNTAIGEINTDPPSFVRSIFSVVLGLAGGIALILIIISGYRFIASGGNPEAIQAARDQLVSAIVGLLFIIFSFVALQIIGVDILRIPGFEP